MEGVCRSCTEDCFFVTAVARLESLLCALRACGGTAATPQTLQGNSEWWWLHELLHVQRFLCQAKMEEEEHCRLVISCPDLES